MTPTVANAILIAVGAYAALGLVFAVPFVSRGAGAIDAAARSAPIGFRLLILPAAAALWPLLLIRWLRSEPDA